MAVQRYAIFPLFAYADLGGAFSPYRLETWLDCTDLAEFLIFFTKKGPSNIAASRLKIGRTKKQENGVSLNAHNFFSMQAI